MIENRLNDVQDNQCRKVGIKVNVECVTPLDILTSDSGFHHQLVGHKPR